MTITSIKKLRLVAKGLVSHVQWINTILAKGDSEHDAELRTERAECITLLDRTDAEIKRRANG